MPTLENGKRAKWLGKRKQFERRKHTNSEFYNSQNWRKTRKVYISNNPLCESCQAKNIIKAGQVVDHITPINQGGAKYNYSNMQTLCHSCHNSKSGKEAHTQGI